MNEQDLLKLLSTPGALALVVLWIHVRLSRVEGRFDVMAAHFGIPKPRRNTGGGFKALMILLIVIFAFFFVAALNLHAL